MTPQTTTSGLLSSETPRGQARAEADARDKAQWVLGAVSLAIWFVLAFALAIRWFVDEYTAPPIFMAGGVAFLVAALPWLGYGRLTRRLMRRRDTR